jgi:hypothetical protein
VIEGEGSFILIERSCPRLEVTNTDTGLLTRCRAIMGGLGKIRLSGKGYARKRDCYRWYVSGDAARATIRAVLPYLVIKAEQAEILLAIRTTIGRHLLPAEREERKRLDLRLRELKRLSRPPPPH